MVLYTFPLYLSQEFPTYPQFSAEVIHSVHNFWGLVEKWLYPLIAKAAQQKKPFFQRRTA